MPWVLSHTTISGFFTVPHDMANMCVPHLWVHTFRIKKYTQKHNNKLFLGSKKDNFSTSEINPINYKRITYILQLVCKSCADELVDAFWAAAWYFWAAAPTWVSCKTCIMINGPFHANYISNFIKSPSIMIPNTTIEQMN